MKMMSMPLIALTIGAFIAPLAAQALPFKVFVGYADSLRPTPFFPAPYNNADIFQGNLGSLDTGAVRIQNTSGANIVLNDLSVQLNPGLAGQVFALWTFGAGLTLGAGQNAVFASTANYNFDTSDFGVLGSSAPITDNCSVGPTALTPLCINNAALVKVTVDSLLTSFSDTAHVLDTGGFDFVFANPCPAPGDVPGQCNESLQWREIGTTGIENPNGGPVPEPGTLALAGLGFMGLGIRRFLRS